MVFFSLSLQFQQIYSPKRRKKNHPTGLSFTLCFCFSLSLLYSISVNQSVYPISIYLLTYLSFCLSIYVNLLNSTTSVSRSLPVAISVSVPELSVSVFEIRVFHFFNRSQSVCPLLRSRLVLITSPFLSFYNYVCLTGRSVCLSVSVCFSVSLFLSLFSLSYLSSVHH